MARSFASIMTRIWSDPDFVALDDSAQRAYIFLISQPNIAATGVLPMTLRRWSGTAANLKPGDVERSLRLLQERRFVIVDWDTEEVMVRTFVRNDEIWKSPKMMLGLVSRAKEIESPHLRSALLTELQRIPLDELSDTPGKTGKSTRQVVAQCVERVQEHFFVPDGTPPPSVQAASDPVADTPSDRVSEPVSGHGDSPVATWEHCANGAGQSNVDTLSKGYPIPTYARVEPSTYNQVLPPTAGRDAPAPPDAPPDNVIPLPGMPPPPTPEPVPKQAEPDPAQPVTTQTLLGELLREIERPPKRVIDQLSREVKSCLNEGFHPNVLREALRRWADSGTHPSTFPSFVHEVINGKPRHLRRASGQHEAFDNNKPRDYGKDEL